MYTRLLFILLVTFSVSACQQKAPAKYSTQELAMQDKAWAKMMEGHDRAMPMMGNLHQAAAQIETIAEQSQTQANGIHPKAMYHLENLETATDGMMDWMAGITDNPLDSLRTHYEDHAAVMAAIDKETTEIEGVENLMTNTLAEAKEFIAAMQRADMSQPE